MYKFIAYFEPKRQTFVLTPMSRFFLVLLVYFSVSSSLQAQTAGIIKMDQLQKMMNSQSDKIQVINFWATWCAPCIKELPLFEQLNQTRSDVQVSLVSVDIDLDPNPEKVYRFIARKKLKSKVYILDETDPNSWINKVDKNWSGAIPATLVLNTSNGKRKFVEKELKEGDLDALVDGVK